MKIAAILATMLLCASLYGSDDSTVMPAGAQRGQSVQHEQCRAKLHQKLLAMFDANHDGKLEGDELVQAKAWLQQKRAEFAQKHPEQAAKLAEMRQKMQAQRGQGGQSGQNPANGAQKTSSAGSAPSANATAAQSDAMQKAMEQFTQEPSVKL